MAGTLRSAGILAKKKGPEIVRALVDGGETRNRTRVRLPGRRGRHCYPVRGLNDLAVFVAIHQLERLLKW